ncbi:MAG: patatin family protein [Firmicutes bacterium]|nr:patatin family protein [Bacillota bacterium]
MDDIGIGLALGAGAARGLAHIGVLQVLDKAGIKVQHVAGTSIGSLIGALFAAGIPLHTLEQLACSIKLKHVVDFAFVPGKGGVIQGQKVRELLNTFLREKTFADLQLPLATVATDLLTGEEVVFREGSVVEAVLASCAIPGVFVPVRLAGRILVDGGLVDRVPVRVAQEMGDAPTVAVDVGPSLRTGHFRSPAEVTMQAIDIMQEEIVRLKASTADVFIRPEVGEFAAVRFDKAADLVQRGRDAAWQALPQIESLIQKRKDLD